MSKHETHLDMLKTVAKALGSDFCRQMAFVGGSTTGLLITDEYTLEQIRGTDDIDLIVHVIGHNGFTRLQKTLQPHGFKIPVPAPGDDTPICAMNLGELRVDFMPDDVKALGFSNRWYSQAMETATDYHLEKELQIRIVTPPYFIATKLEAWIGRGDGDALESRDIEDIINLIDGRKELLQEIEASHIELRRYISHELEKLIADDNFEYAVQSHTRASTEREAIIFARIERLIKVSG